MRTVKLVEHKKLEITEENQIPKPHSDEVVIHIKSAGICGSDLHIYEGHRPDIALPVILGHELAGVVHEVGSDVKGFNVGDRVVIDPVVSCGRCYACKKGWNNLCEVVACLGCQVDGGFTDYIKISEKNVYKIPDDVTWEQAAMIEPFSIAAEVLDRSRAKAGERVVIYGAGTIGLCVVQVLKMMGLKVLVTDVIDSRLQKALELGADAAVNSKTIDLQTAVADFTNGDGAELVIDAVGNPKLFEQALILTAPGGRIVVLGFDATPAQIPEVVLVKKELEIIGSRLNRYRFPQVIEWFENKQLNAEAIISAVYSLNELNEAFEQILSNPAETLKVVIKY